MLFSILLALAKSINMETASVFVISFSSPLQYLSNLLYPADVGICNGLFDPSFFNGHQAQPILFLSKSEIASVNQAFDFSPDSPIHTGTFCSSRIFTKRSMEF